jgi:nitrite reductase/ring-hydroxylating ferredoxin subunit
MGAGESATVDVGPLSDFATDGPVDKFAKSHKLLVVRDGGRLFAPTALCTHKRAVLMVDGGQIVCPKHDSPFDNQGVPLAQTADGEETPAKQPLERFAISVNGQGRVIVDRAKRFGRDQWDDAASFVKLDA